MDWINRLYLKIESQKLELEKANKSLQTLFKAWPHPDEEKPNVDSTSLPCKDLKDTDQIIIAPDLTEEEKQGVSLVDDLLQKAQKARDVQKKLEEPKRNRINKEFQSKPSDTSDTAQVKQDISTKNGVVKVTDHTKPTHSSVTKQTNSSKGTSDTSSISNSKTNKTGPGNKSSNSVFVKSSDTKQLKSSTSDRSNSRLASTVNKTAGRRVTPAHVNAPFQTNPRLTSGKLRTEYSVSTGKVISSAKNAASQAARVKGSYSAPLKRPVTKESDKKKTAVPEKPVPQKQMAMNKTETNNNDSRLNNSSPEMNIAQQTCDKNTEGNVKLKDVKDKDVDVLQQNDSEGEPEPEENRFWLLKDGHSLCLPGKLRKLAGINRKLRQKMFTQNVTTKVDSPQPSKQFPLELQHAFGDPETLEVQMVARQAEYLINVYKNLTDMLEELHVQTINCDSGPEQVLFAKKSLEYILTTFHVSESHLHSINMGILKSVNGYSGNNKKKIQTSNHSTNVWYPRTNLDFMKSCTVKYRRYKQLEQYTSLVHRAQILQLQIDSMDIFGQQALPLLQSLQPNSSEFLQVLHCAYSLLSTNPNRVPVIVKDTDEDNKLQEPDNT